MFSLDSLHYVMPGIMSHGTFSILNLTHNVLTNTYQTNQEIFDAYMLITTPKNNPLFQLHFYDAWIETFSSISMQTTSGDDNPYNMTLGVKYNFYTIETA